MKVRSMVLLVEDDDTQRMGMSIWLKGDGFQVVDCASAESALKACAKHDFSVVVTDLRLPGQSGLDLIHEVRKRPEPVGAVLVTQFADMQTAIDALREGANDFVAKPLDKEEFLRSVRRAAQFNELARENRRLRLELEEDLTRTVNANDRLTAFAGNVAHDLRAPMRTARLWLEFAREALDIQDHDSLPRYLEAATRSLSSGHDIIAALLSLSRAGAMDASPKPVVVSEVIAPILRDCHMEFKQREFEVFSAVEGTVVADPMLLSIALTNVIHNAFKYSSLKEHPCIDIRGAADDGHYSIQIQDNGIGINPAQMDRLFRPFSRLPEARAFGGSGLGLVGVKTIIDRHCGRINVTSDGHSGTHVLIQLPRNGSTPSAKTPLPKS